MKISRIEINRFRNLHNLSLNLTYPEGHEKAGEPLDRVCIVGQSGAGKTNLLEMLWDVNAREHRLHDYVSLPYKTDEYDYSVFTQELDFIKEQHSFTGKNSPYDTFTEWDHSAYRKRTRSSQSTYFAALYYPVDCSHNNGDPYEVSESEGLLYNDEKARFNNERAVVNKTAPMLQLCRKHAQDFFRHYNLTLARYRTDFHNKELAYLKESDTQEKQRLFNHFETWKKRTPDPIHQIADILDEVIALFHLRIKREFIFEQPEDLFDIAVENEKGERLRFNQLSTGTQNIMIRLSSLALLDTENSILLMDEPENSLYPDLQRVIIETYSKYAKGQMIVATHSPFIVSAFEPWEVVELDWNGEGRVIRKEYYRGERHIDNYFNDPRYLRWDQIAIKNLGTLKNGNEAFRNREIAVADRFRRLIENEENPQKREEHEKRYRQAARKLGWELGDND